MNEITELDYNFLEQNRKEKTLAVVVCMQEEGKPLREALKKCNMTVEEWRTAKSKGVVESVNQLVARERASIITEVLLPGTRKRLEILADMAEGKSPVKGMKLQPTHILKAIEVTQQMIESSSSGTQNDLEFLNTFKPTAINITQNNNHIYNGSGNSYAMGKMPSLADDPEYELVEVNS